MCLIVLGDDRVSPELFIQKQFLHVCTNSHNRAYHPRGHYPLLRVAFCPVPYPAMRVFARMAGGTTSPRSGQSTLIIAFRDAPMITDIGTVNNLFSNHGEMSVHRTAVTETAVERDDEMEATESDDSGTAGWIIVLGKPWRVDLLQLTEC